MAQGADRARHRFDGRPSRGGRRWEPSRGRPRRAGAAPAGRGRERRGREPEIVAEALRELWQRGGFKGKRVYMGVGNQRVVVREIALPYLPGEGAAGLARVPGAGIRPDVGRRSGAGLRPVRGVRAGRPPDAADAPGGGAANHGRRLVAAATGAKLEPVGLDLVSFAMVRSVGTTGVGMDLEDDGDEAVIDIGAHVTNIVVHAAAPPGSSASFPREGAISRWRSPAASGSRRRRRATEAR